MSGFGCAFSAGMNVKSFCMTLGPNSGIAHSYKDIPASSFKRIRKTHGDYGLDDLHNTKTFIIHMIKFEFCSPCA